MFRSAGQAVIQGAGKFQQFATEHPDVIKTIAAGLTAVGVRTTSVLTYKADCGKTEAQNRLSVSNRALADSNKYMAYKKLEAAKYKADMDFQIQNVKQIKLKSRKFTVIGFR
jgi:hypothetical protein